MARYGYGMSVSGTRALGKAVASVSPIPLDSLSLWLKGDAGVTKLSYNYASTIVISGTSNPSFAGTYTADSVPTYNAEENQVNNYTLSGSEGRSIAWNIGDSEFFLSSTGSVGSFVSGDGANWSAYNPFVAQVIIIGFTGTYAGANGTYARSEDGSNLERVGGGFFIDSYGLRESDYEVLFATPPANYSGSWTPTTYINSVTLTGANTTVVNGVYTRTDSEIREQHITFFGSGGKKLYWNGDNWLAQDADAEFAYYVSSDLINWTVSTHGTAPAPAGATATSARSVGSPTSTSLTVPSGSISGSVTNTAENTELVTAWADQSGNGNNATSPTTAPTFVSSSINSKPAISFNADGSWMQVLQNSIGNNGNISIFTVLNYASGLVILNKGDAVSFEVTAWEINTTNGFGFVNFDGEEFSWNTVPVSLETSTPLLLEGFSSGGASQLAFDGVDSGSPSGANVGFNNITQYIGIGGGGTDGANQGNPLDARIAEIIIYNRAVTTPERQQVEAYLNTKYAIY